MAHVSKLTSSHLADIPLRIHCRNTHCVRGLGRLPVAPPVHLSDSHHVLQELLGMSLRWKCQLWMLDFSELVASRALCRRVADSHTADKAHFLPVEDQELDDPDGRGPRVVETWR